jgi:hypothetical protein
MRATAHLIVTAIVALGIVCPLGAPTAAARSWKIPVGIVATAVGGAAAGIAAGSFVFQDTSNTCDDSDNADEPECQRERANKRYGGAAFLGGGALLAGGIVLIVSGKRDDRRAASSASMLQRQDGLSLGWSASHHAPTLSFSLSH